jgi:8-oxo-dGTP pyrophosphatase MutT (NUDIX family)
VTRTLSCGVVVTDGDRVLIGHATRSPRWDIPKGVAEPGESPEQAARRELLEETGLEAPPDLVALGQHGYLPRKDLALFAWQSTAMPDPGTLICRSTFLVAGTALPEFDRFACVPWAEALSRLGKSMIAVLTTVARDRRWI